jgi:F0F1-type ATP synthase assembly protein I
MGLGFELVAPILLGVWAGYRLDSWWGTKPWSMVVGALLGMAVGFYTFLRGALSRGGHRP